MTDALDLGTRRELFVDRFLLAELDGAALRLHTPVGREVVFQAQPPLENACTACYNLVRDGDRILLYYRGFYPIGADYADHAESQTANLAISEDGIHFERAELDLFEMDAAPGLNCVVWKGYEAHNLCAFRDDNPAAAPAGRFKAVGGGSRDRLFGFQSADGVHWERLGDEPLRVTGAFDSVNVPLWDPALGRYRLFSRYFDADAAAGSRVRAIQSCTSEDFVHWTTPERHRYGADDPVEHFYTNATVCCPGAEHILLSFPMRFFPDRTLSTQGMDYPGDGLSDAVFITSRDGVRWDRTYLQAWLRPGRDPRCWTHRNMVPAVGIVETGDEWSMYAIEHYGWDDNRLRRLTLRPWGFASLGADGRGGEARTHVLRHGGRRLHLNYATSAAGSVRVELQDAAGMPLAGFTLADCEPIFGDELDGVVRWRGSDDLSALTGQPVRLRLVLDDADLFSLRFA